MNTCPETYTGKHSFTDEVKYIIKEGYLKMGDSAWFPTQEYVPSSVFSFKTGRRTCEHCGILDDRKV